MSNLEKVLRFRAAKNPVAGYWLIGGHKIYGSLIWENGNPILKVIFEGPLNATEIKRERTHELIQLTSPPIQPTIVGKSDAFGTITLENCARFNVIYKDNYTNNLTDYELSFQPTKVWIGNNKEILDSNISYAFVEDMRLHGFFGSPGLKFHHSFGDENKDIFAKLANPDAIWTYRQSATINASLGSTGFDLSVGSGLSESHSSTSGSSVAAVTQIQFSADAPKTISEFLAIVSKFEQILAVFALEHFAFQAVTFVGGEGMLRTTLAWQLGEKGDLFEPPLRHQILIDLSDEKTLQTVCRSWFSSSQTVELSRWLFCRSLAETRNGLARFVGVAQALEVVGREFGPTPAKIPRAKLKAAVAAIREVLTEDFDEDFIQRTVQLVSSSNRASFRDVLRHMIDRVLQSGRIALELDAEAFSKKVADTRNAVVHMTDNDRGALNDAFSSVNKLGLMLSFWYAMIQAVIIDVPVENGLGFLLNNRNARHGLPNEVLERL